MITENLSTLTIHKLTQEQYDRELAAGRIDENALYLTPDEETDMSIYATNEYVDGLATDIAGTKTDPADKTTINGAKNYAKEYTDLEIEAINNTISNLSDEVNNKAGLKTNGATYTDSDGNTYTCRDGEVFNYYGENITLGSNGCPDKGNIASGSCSHAEGHMTIASGDASHTEGDCTIASGTASHAEGYGTVASGAHSHAEGYGTVASGEHSHAEGYCTIANAYQHVSGKYNEEKSAPATADTQDSTGNDAIFVVGYGTSTTRANAFRITSGGKCRGVSTFTASGADFAELFEWEDGNSDNEDRRGLFVTLDGEKIRLANADDDYIGVISGAQSFVGNTASEEWQGKYLTDVFGARLSQKVEIPEKIDEVTGDVIPAYTTTQFIVNPDYNPDEEYIMRESRKEWGAVGLLGQVVVIDDGTCTVGGYVKPFANGIGTASDTGYRVMKRIDENHIKVLVR